MLTCLVGRRLGDDASSQANFGLRDLAASLIGMISRKYGKASHTLKPRLARTCLKHFLDPNKPLAVHYGAVFGLQAVGGAEAVRVLILPNIKTYESVLKDAMASDGPRKADAEVVASALVKVLASLETDHVSMTNGSSGNGGSEMKEKLDDRLGELIGDRVFELGRAQLSQAIVEAGNVA